MTRRLRPPTKTGTIALSSWFHAHITYSCPKLTFSPVWNRLETTGRIRRVSCSSSRFVFPTQFIFSKGIIGYISKRWFYAPIAGDECVDSCWCERLSAGEGRGERWILCYKRLFKSQCNANAIPIYAPLSVVVFSGNQRRTFRREYKVPDSSTIQKLQNRCTILFRRNQLLACLQVVEQGHCFIFMSIREIRDYLFCLCQGSQFGLFEIHSCSIHAIRVSVSSVVKLTKCDFSGGFHESCKLDAIL